MKNHYIRIFFLFLFTSLWSPLLKAKLASSFDANVGISSISLSTKDFSKNLSSTSSVELNYVLKHEAVSTAYVMTFTEILSAGGKQIPLAMFSAGFRYYPSGFNGYRLILDQGVQAKVWKATSFVGMNLGIANVSIDELNASVIDISPRFGVELPISSSIMAQAQLVLQSANSTGTSEQTSIKYTGVSAYLGVLIVDF